MSLFDIYKAKKLGINAESLFASAAGNLIRDAWKKGFNKWDEEWELGLIYNDTGQNRDSNDYIRSKNYIPILPSTEYYIKIPVGDAPLYFYDADHNYITPYFGGAAGKFTSPANAYFMRFRLGGNYGTVYNNDVCVNISGEHDGDYVPYDGE